MCWLFESGLQEHNSQGRHYKCLEKDSSGAGWNRRNVWIFLDALDSFRPQMPFQIQRSSLSIQMGATLVRMISVIRILYFSLAGFEGCEIQSGMWSHLSTSRLCSQFALSAKPEQSDLLHQPSASSASLVTTFTNHRGLFSWNIELCSTESHLGTGCAAPSAGVSLFWVFGDCHNHPKKDSYIKYVKMTSVECMILAQLVMLVTQDS